MRKLQERADAELVDVRHANEKAGEELIEAMGALLAAAKRFAHARPTQAQRAPVERWSGGAGARGTKLAKAEAMVDGEDSAGGCGGADRDG